MLGSNGGIWGTR